MLLCWEPLPVARPTFRVVHQELSNYDLARATLRRGMQIDFTCPSEEHMIPGAVGNDNDAYGVEVDFEEGAGPADVAPVASVSVAAMLRDDDDEEESTL